MAKIIYNSGHLAPIEAVSVSYEPVFDENGDRLSTSYNISIRGKLLASKGSPTSSGTFVLPASTCEVIAETGINETNWTESLLRKRCAVNNLVKEEAMDSSIESSSCPQTRGRSLTSGKKYFMKGRCTSRECSFT